jgi:sialate O-acetylesterase
MFVAAITLGPLAGLRAEVRLPKVFGSHMVFQQEKTLVVWGWAQPGEAITVKFSSATVHVQANASGEWKAILPAMKAGGPYELVVTGSSTIRFEDVMIGEVWLCSGQSNMYMGMGLVAHSKKEIANANYPGIRLLLVGRQVNVLPQDNFDGVWKVCSPASVAEGGWNGFSAAAYFFGRELHRKLGLTIGLIEASVGGTRVQPWTPPEGFAAVPALKKECELVELGDPRTPEHEHRLAQTLAETRRWLAAAGEALTNRTAAPSAPVYPAELSPHDLQDATMLYNGMIHPLCPFALRGAIWYQGESNLGDGMFYTERMKALIAGWRQLWNEGDFPFYFVQIAPFNHGGNPEAMPELWEAQVAAQAIPNTGMVVVNDIGDIKDVHPQNKQEVGRRLALWALARTYGQDTPPYLGPDFKSMEIEGDKLRLRFDHVGGGLTSRDGKPLSWFEIIDADAGGFVQAEARLDGPTVVLSSPEVKHPVAMRFAWSMLAQPNLMNAEGLPAGGFRAGNVPGRLSEKHRVP